MEHLQKAQGLHLLSEENCSVKIHKFLFLSYLDWTDNLAFWPLHP